MFAYNIHLPILRRGSTGPLVALVQSMLARHGFFKGTIDGIFDAHTEECISKFQNNWHMQATGYVDDRVWRLLLDDTITCRTPSYDSLMVRSGILLILTTDKPVYAPGDTVMVSLIKLNLSGTTEVFNYNTSQRYDFEVFYPDGRILWRWSDDKSFTQATGTLALSPGRPVIYKAHFVLPSRSRSTIYSVVGWNTAKQLDHIRLCLK
ncbi:MAG TPA: BsuPI-related putative proteinase inhibitor, partial [Candidatus Atribacteria bacterium]|nr:BsuPI-related putative proteinase inhibitor [Candidatus Atribacteria bacterium]